MPIAELTDTGIQIETLPEILDGIAAAQRDPETGIDPDIDNTPKSPLGVANAIVAERFREVAEVLVALHGAAYPNSSRGQALSSVSKITGTRRDAPSKSTVTATVNLDPGTELVAGDAAHVVDRPLDRYEVPVGTSVTNDGGEVADFEVELEATLEGSATRANAGRLTVIATPKAGWNSVTNDHDSAPGADEEDDTPLRIRRDRELSSRGGATFAKMVAQLRLLAGVTSVDIIENASVVWKDGVPPKSFEALVLGGLDQDIWDTVWKYKPQGVEPFGTDLGTALDVNGNGHTVGFSRPAEVAMFVEVTVKRGRGYVGDELVKESIVDAGAQYGIGSLVTYRILSCAPLHAGDLDSPLNGVLDVPSFSFRKESGSASMSNIQMNSREKPVFDTSRVALTVIGSSQ